MTMDIAHPATLLLPAGVAALVIWRVYSRVKRMVGRQRLSRVRPWMTVIFFPVIVSLLFLGALIGHSASAFGLAGGVVFGAALGWYGLRLTKFEPTPEGLFYTPNAHLGIALSLLFIGRLVYRAVQLYAVSGSLEASDPSAFARSPITMVIFGCVLGWYGLRLTKFEVTQEGMFYTPNAHLGIALSLLFIGRLAYRAVQLYAVSGSLEGSDPNAFARSPITMVIFGTLAGYYVAYAIGLLRWRYRVGKGA